MIYKAIKVAVCNEHKVIGIGFIASTGYNANDTYRTVEALHTANKCSCRYEVQEEK